VAGVANNFEISQGGELEASWVPWRKIWPRPLILSGFELCSIFDLRIPEGRKLRRAKTEGKNAGYVQPTSQLQ
jgi:hypothetical protein